MEVMEFLQRINYKNNAVYIIEKLNSFVWDKIGKKKNLSNR